MKKLIVVSIVLLLAVLVCLSVARPTSTNADYLRIHIRADSNTQADQKVKYAVKQAVVNYLTPKLAYATDKTAAMHVVSAELSSLERVANRVLADNGFAYKCHARLDKEEFPCRTYGSLTLQSGVYDALILDLGSGNGNNWWCVVYPPLCFVGQSDGTDKITYRSLLVEIIEKFFAEHN